MKIAGILAILMVVLACPAQGLKLAADDFRIVDGVLYNIRLSQKWSDIAPDRDLVVVAVHTNGYVLEERWTELIYGAPDVNHLERVGGGGGGLAFRRVIGRKARVGREVFVKNYPRKLADGDRLASWRALPIGPVLIDGKTIQAFDCGLPNTPENRSNLKAP